MNILIKLMSIVSLVIAPTLAQINAKKPLPTSAGKTGQIKTINISEPVAKIKESNTVQYQ
jgi:hypothetical protein